MNQTIKNRIEQINRGEVPDGYKYYSIQKCIPINWSVKKIKGLTSVTAGGTPQTNVAEYWDGDIPWMSSGELNNKRIFSTAQKITKSGLNNSSTKLIPEKCVLVGLAGQGKTRGTAAINEIKLCINQSIGAIYPSDNLDSNYLYFYIDSLYEYLRKLSSGDGGRGGLNIGILENILLALPTKVEQQQIAEILMKWDEAVELQKKLVNQCHLQKEAIVETIFRNSTHWIKVGIKKLVIQCAERNLIGCKNVLSVNNKLGFIQQAEQFDKIVASKDLRNYKIVRKYDIAYNPSRINVGSIAINETDEIGIVSPMYSVFRCKESIDPYIFLEILNTSRVKYYIKSSLSGSVRDSLNFDDLCNIEIPVPSKTEQKKLKSALFYLYKHIHFQTQKLEALKKQRKALRQLLLTGIVRV